MRNRPQIAILSQIASGWHLKPDLAPPRALSAMLALSVLSSQAFNAAPAVGGVARAAPPTMVSVWEGEALASVPEGVLKLNSRGGPWVEQRSRPRRNRKSAAMRKMVSETSIAPSNFIYPLFIHDEDANVAIASMPGCERHSLASMVAEAKDAYQYGVRSFVLFPKVPDAVKTNRGEEAYNPDGIVPRAVTMLKLALPDAIVCTDVALDPYSSKGHDGIVEDGKILNDETIEQLCKQSICQARAGSDVIAPSDMMDGRVGAIRDALDAEVSGRRVTAAWPPLGHRLAAIGDRRVTAVWPTCHRRVANVSPPLGRRATAAWPPRGRRRAIPRPPTDGRSPARRAPSPPTHGPLHPRPVTPTARRARTLRRASPACPSWRTRPSTPRRTTDPSATPSTRTQASGTRRRTSRTRGTRVRHSSRPRSTVWRRRAA